MERKTIGFVGGGRITKIFLEGFRNVGVEFENVTIFDPNEDNLS